jgi:hypothetical protein
VLETGCFYAVRAEIFIRKRQSQLLAVLHERWEAVKIVLLEAVAREWLVKHSRLGKGLACAVVICELWRFGGAVITCISESCVSGQ